MKKRQIGWTPSEYFIYALLLALILLDMAASSSFHGARARVSIFDPATGLSRVIGLWNSIDVDGGYDVRAQYILGRVSPAALTTVGSEVVNIRCGGWVIVDHSLFKEGAVTNLKDVLLQEYITMAVEDRQTGKILYTILGCKPTNFSMSLSAKELATGTNSYLGMIMSVGDLPDQAEPANATTLP